MIDFACKKFDLDDIVKCGLGLTKSEYQVLMFFLENLKEEWTSGAIAKNLKLNQTTIQKALKKLTEHKILKRQQKNLENGGYLFVYKLDSRGNVREVLKRIIRNWSERVIREIDRY